MELELGLRSDKGRVRENNEDSLCAAPDLNLFVVSDGMGGRASGEVASRIVTETIVAHCREAETNQALDFFGARIEGASKAANRLASGIRLANREVRRAMTKDAALAGMGATVVALQICDERVIVAHVGDSRAYRLRDGEIEPLTRDHSFIAEQVRLGMMSAEEASQSKLQNVLLRAIGPDEELDVEISEELLREDDGFLLCSDGLTHELSDDEIAAAWRESEDSEETVERLIASANEAGGNDNISIIVIRCAPRPVGAMARIGRWFRSS